jgi:F-type H+-transporting ATPase subunit b
MKKTAFVILFIFTVLFFRVCDPQRLAVAEEVQTAAQSEHSGEASEHESLGSIIGKWINFAALVAILYLFLKKGLKVQDTFKTGAQEILRSIESAKLAKEDAERKLEEMDRQLVDMNAEIDKIKTDAVREAEEEKERILESARKEAERLVEFAHREIESEVRHAKKQLRKQVAESAVTQSRKIIEREIKDADHERLIADYIEGFGK